MPSSELIDEGYYVYGANGIIGKYSEYNHKFPTLVITCRGATCGNLHITKPYSYINSNAMALDELSGDVDVTFLYYALLKRGFNDVITGSAQPQITREGLSKIKIPLPPLSDQIRIAEILSRAEAIISNRKGSISLLDELLKSTFWEMFGDPVKNEKGWPQKALEDILKIKHGFAFKSEYFSNEGKFVLLTPGNFYEEGGYKDRGEKQKYYVGEFPVDYLLKQGSLLIAMTEQAPGLLGSPILIPNSNVFLHNQRLGLVVHDPKNLNNKFLFHLFNFYKIRALIHSKATGTKVRHTSPTKIQEIIIGIPPIELQTKFGAIVEKVEALRGLYKKSLIELQSMYGVLSQKAFKGELNLTTIEIINESMDAKKKDLKIDLREEYGKIMQSENEKLDISNLSLDEYLGIPSELIQQNDKWMFDFINDDVFYQFLLKDGFKDKTFTLEDIDSKYFDFFQNKGDIDFDYEKWKNIIFKFMETTPPLIEQMFEEETKTIKLKLTNEAYKA